jgi:hypothetical protein
MENRERASFKLEPPADLHFICRSARHDSKTVMTITTGQQCGRYVAPGHAQHNHAFAGM